MYYELYDGDTDTFEKGYALINLDQVIQINLNADIYRQRNEKTGKVSEWYRLKIYYTGKSNEGTFYYRSESERFLAYDNLKKALKENSLFIKEKLIPNPLVDEVITDTINAIEKDFHPLEDILSEGWTGDIPEVKY